MERSTIKLEVSLINKIKEIENDILSPVSLFQN